MLCKHYSNIPLSEMSEQTKLTDSKDVTIKQSIPNTPIITDYTTSFKFKTKPTDFKFPTGYLGHIKANGSNKHSTEYQEHQSNFYTN